MSEKVVSYAVEWQTVHKPGVWELYSSYYTDPKKAMSSYEAAQKNPCVIELRFVERVVQRREISVEQLQKRKADNLPYEMEVPMPREGFGFSRFVGKDAR